MSLPFRDRDPVKVGAVGLVFLVLILLGAFRVGDLPLIGGGETFHAEFAEAGGIKANDPVLIAGVRVGKVTAIELDGGHVLVTFRLQGAGIGDATTAEIKMKTLLGAMYLALTPAGDGELKEGGTIPLSRTRSPYEVVAAFADLAEHSAAIDTTQLAEAMHTMSDLMAGTPREFRAALTGVSRLSANLAARDQQLDELLAKMRSVSGVLADRDQDVVALMRRSVVLFDALTARRVAVHNLLTATSRMSREITGLVRDSRADLAPALDNLQMVVRLLVANQANLDQSLRLMAPFTRVMSSVVGNGPWFDGIIQNLPPAPSIPESRP